MAKSWNSWRNQWETKDPWQYRQERSHYGWLLRTGWAIFIFIVIYASHISDTALGDMTDRAVRYILTYETDFGYITQLIEKRLPPNLDISALKRVQSAVSRPADPLLYMSKPVDGQLVGKFGWTAGSGQKQQSILEGINIAAQTGSSVHAVAPGKIKLITESDQWGRTVVIDHGQNIETIYGYLGEVLVTQGEMVSQGQVIARVGPAGTAKSPLLYFEVRENGKPIDPLTRIKGEFTLPERK
ncbi:peptidase m23 [Lucifera butyrica]|uniref:Peptidase m23 n=1 Tax=Lucifera butyrica TaxID=1351585 RepID=A0A498RAA0_9FIRM|nr:M23 family metallopeptidase [Lucifera butyrica]VBB07870.1 peptidase m23 [Lucifera butyrica]